MVPLFGLQSMIVTFHGHSHFLANIVFSGMIKKLLLAIKEQVVAGKHIQAKIMTVCCYICYGLDKYMHIV